MDKFIFNFSEWLRKLSRQAYFPFLVAFIVSGVICLVALRHNNSQMVKLREAVYTADKNGGNVNAALNNLRTYVYGHMNTNLSAGSNIKPPIQLAYTYQRLETAAQAKAGNAGLYTTAEDYCQKVVPGSVSFYGAGRIPCVTSYITSHGGQPPAQVPAGLYEFDFQSPSWSPDLAGWSLVVAIIAGLATVITFILSKFTSLKLPRFSPLK
ncbi:MAG TPA: hypothetical protein VFP35_00490 [Candidatus Saccharimonadales bacterium]|nr:hypothetical protein [Candidatus Saccharimonadales bacterium]